MYRTGHELNEHLIYVKCKICGGQYISIIKQKYHSIIEIASEYIAFESIQHVISMRQFHSSNILNYWIIVWGMLRCYSFVVRLIIEHKLVMRINIIRLRTYHFHSDIFFMWFSIRKIRRPYTGWLYVRWRRECVWFRLFLYWYSLFNHSVSMHISMVLENSRSDLRLLLSIWVYP